VTGPFQATTSGRNASYRIVFTGKECLEYQEGDEAFAFVGSWGVEPVELYVPRAEDWDRVVPEAFRGRREVIVARLKNDPRLVRVRFVDAFA
jgi:hypothetical protein